jgi:glyceraldehyde-3-phosphate dehydrogenase (NAD(P))
MIKTKVAVAGYGVIGQRLADGVSLQEDMDLVGIVDVAPTLALRALAEKGMPYKLFIAQEDQIKDLENAGIPVSGKFDTLLKEVDIVLDAAAAGIGEKNKILYEKHQVNAIFQGGESGSIANVFFHGYANYDKGIGQKYLKLTSCNTTGLIRAVDSIDRAFGVKKAVVTIIRRVADPGDTHRGLVDMALVEPVPNHQVVDLMKIMPHIQATGTLVHVPTTHGHIISVVLTPEKPVKQKEHVVEVLNKHPRIKVVKISEGFNSNTAMFRYARDLGNLRGDMYEIAVFDETVGFSGDDIIFTFNVPQEAVVIPETIDGIRASLKLQVDQEEAVSLTNRYLNMK